MNSSGISRRIDELGRIVIPVEIRKNLNLKEGENLEFSISDNNILLKKKSYVESNYQMLTSIFNSFNSVINGEYFITDRDKILISSNNKLVNKKLSDNLYNLLNVHNQSVINNKIILDDVTIDNSIYIYPYYSENNIIGLICLYNIDNIEKYNKLVCFVINYIRSKISLS